MWRNNRTRDGFKNLRHRIEVVQLLLEHHADIESRDENNQTPLDVARSVSSSINTEAVIRLLMEHTTNSS